MSNVLLSIYASLLVAALAGIVSCGLVPLQVRPLMGEGSPPGYISGAIPSRYAGMRNPFTPADVTALAAGAILYVSFEPSCAACHGTAGRGDGPMAAYLEPQPNDYAAPLPLSAFRDHQDYVFWWVSEGLPKTSMPAWQDRLNETQRWQVITFAWHLGEQGAAGARTGPGRGMGEGGVSSRYRRFPSVSP